MPYSKFDTDPYIGLPFEQHDCYGLLTYVYQDALGVSLPSFDIGTNESKRTYFNFLKEIEENWVEVNRDDIQLYDVVAMAYLPQHPNIIQHFGLYIGNGKMLHTLKHVNAHIISLEHPAIRRTIKGVYRWNQ